MVLVVVDLGFGFWLTQDPWLFPSLYSPYSDAPSLGIRAPLSRRERAGCPQAVLGQVNASSAPSFVSQESSGHQPRSVLVSAPRLRPGTIMIGPRTIAMVPPQEAGALLFERMTGSERLGQPFEFKIDVLSKTGEIPIPDVLGKPFSVALERADQPPRWFSGIVAEFALMDWTGEYFRYRAHLRPLVWLLTRTSNCRVFQDITVPDLITELFAVHGVTVKKQLGRDSYAPREYLVQYNETDFNFLSRLMEHEGIYYYFVHDEGSHTLMLVDANTFHHELPGHEQIPFSASGHHPGGQGSREYIDAWSAGMQVEPGAYAAKDFDFEKPRAPLLSIANVPNPHAHAGLEMFEYPGHHLASGQRDDYVRRRLDEQQVDYERVQGAGNARGLMPGFLFTLTDHPADKQNLEYLVTAASYALTSTQYASGGTETGPDYRCTFSGIQSKRPFQPRVATPKPIVPGPQTAIVVGPAGNEIWTDKYGRVKVQFHWDRLGNRDEKSSCWVRVAQVWAGSQWGAMHIPRIGQEVLVDFLEGDPDRPIVTGRVYNGDLMPPYSLPANQTQSGIKSRSTKSGAPSNFNELRFEDKKGAEHVFLQAEKDLQIFVKNDERRQVGHDRIKEVTNDETTSIGGSRDETVTKDESISIGGSRDETVALTESVSIGIARNHTVGAEESVSVGGSRSLSVGASDSTSVGGSQSVSVGGSRSLDVGKDQSISIAGGRTLTIAKDDSITISGKRTESISKDGTLTVGKKLLIDAGDELTIKSGDASIILKKNGDITIKGKNISIAGSGKINAKADGDVIIKGSKISKN
jgi:type VI secretion system secreted protein VgrG